MSVIVTCGVIVIGGCTIAGVVTVLVLRVTAHDYRGRKMGNLLEYFPAEAYACARERWESGGTGRLSISHELDGLFQVHHLVTSLWIQEDDVPSALSILVFS